MEARRVHESEPPLKFPNFTPMSMARSECVFPRASEGTKIVSSGGFRVYARYAWSVIQCLKITVRCVVVSWSWFLV